jgi:hypothetical protein
VSEIIEGFVTRARQARVRRALALDPTLRFNLVPLDGYCVGGRIASRDDAFSPHLERIVANLSTFSRGALLFRYDSRIGHRSAALFETGELVASFDEDAEEWVPLDEKGEPVLKAPRLRRQDLEPGKDYETVMNAIDLGLRALAGAELRWEDVQEALSAASG